MSTSLVFYIIYNVYIVFFSFYNRIGEKQVELLRNTFFKSGTSVGKTDFGKS